jgi:hypothetical protein
MDVSATEIPLLSSGGAESFEQPAAATTKHNEARTTRTL